MKQLVEHINKKINTGINPFNLSYNDLQVQLVEKFTDKIVNNFNNKKILIKINENYLIGNFNPYKGKYAIFENGELKQTFSLNEITEIQHKNKKILKESITKEEDGLHVRSKKGKNLGGPYKSMEAAKERLKEVEYFKHVKEENLILREKLKDRFFKLQEEIVNKDNKGKLTAGRQASRDKIEKKLKDVKVIKGPPGRMDTPEEARYRLATFIELKKGKKD
jgi:hypothetical protein